MFKNMFCYTHLTSITTLIFYYAQIKNTFPDKRGPKDIYVCWGGGGSNAFFVVGYLKISNVCKFKERKKNHIC